LQLFIRGGIIAYTYRTAADPFVAAVAPRRRRIRIAPRLLAMTIGF